MPSVYEKLRERLDMFPQGFPKTKSGVELEILENLFSTDEAEIALDVDYAYLHVRQNLYP